jgi:hypothetical protein
MISPMTLDAGASTGSIPSGRPLRAVASFSVTTWRACVVVMSHSNSAHTREMPTAELERTRLSPGLPWSACSMGNVTRRSTSSGASAFASVTIVTEGADSSGNTSTGIVRAA